MKPITFLFLTAAAFCVPALAENSGTLNIYVLTGQSNSLGAVKGSPLSDEKIASHATDASQIKLYHSNFSSSGYFVPVESQSWGAVVPQLPEYSSNYCMGPEYGFAYLVAKKNWQSLLGGNEGDFGIVKASRDGGSNSLWTKTGAAYASVVDSVGNAVKKALSDGYTSVNVVGLIYLQGESNSEADAAVAGDRLKELVSNLKTDLGNIENVTISDSFHVAAGENASWNLTGTHSGKDLTTRDNLKNAVSAEISTGTSFGEWVPTHDLAKITSGDTLKVHFDGQSQLTIGARYAYVEAFRAGYVENEAIRNFDLDATLNSVNAYHAAKIPTNEIVRWDVASSAISKVGDGNVKLYGIKVDADSGNYLQTGATLISGTTDFDADNWESANRLTIGAGGISAEKNVDLETNLGADASQVWNIADGAILKIGGSLLLELGTENSATALIEKIGAGAVKFADEATLGIVLSKSCVWAAGDYDLKVFSGFDDDDLKNFESSISILNESAFEIKDFNFDASSGTLKISIVPEPSAFGLFASLGALLIATGTRKRRK